MIKVIYNKVCGRCVQSEPLTSGMVGQPIHFEYSHDFDGLAVTAVFTDGKNTVDVVNPGNECIIPHEVLTTVGAVVKVGIYAVKGDELVIPTVYAHIKKENVTLTANTDRITNVSYTAKYFPLLGMVFVRIYGTISADLNVSYNYNLFTIGSRVPDSNAALSVKCAKNAMALAKTSSNGSAIQISPLESGINGYDVYITGFWFV